MSSTTALLVNRANITETELAQFNLADLHEGQVSIKVDDFALTSNNVTYAAIGEMLQYWNFFPSPKEGYGIVPVWGFATVEASKHPDIAVGTILYGYLPMGNRFIAEPGKITPFGFRDMAAHRQANAPIYNTYDFIKAGMKDQKGVDYLPVIRPLFTTSYMLYHFFNEERSFGAEQVVITSASSKTGLAMAAVLKDHQSDMGIQIIGYTSASNMDFVRSTGFYDQVLEYDDMDGLAKTTTSVADFRGNKQFLIKLNDVLGDQLTYISAIGLTDWQKSADPSPVPKAKMFFAPTYVQQLFKEIGVAEGTQMIQSAMMKFIGQIAPHMPLNRISGMDQVKGAFDNMVSGNVNPKEGLLIAP